MKFVRFVADTVGSVWFGVSVLVAILAYCWLGSAGTHPFYPWFIRQTFEKTEMEWFAWWPFNLLMALLVLAISLVTVRRIKFSVVKLGVWMVHVGIVVLVFGCVVYFGRKIEGDMPVYRRLALIETETDRTEMILRPGEQARVSAPDRDYVIGVATLNPEYELLTGDDKGKRTYSAQLTVQPIVDGRELRPYIRQVLVGYPEYTEDVIPGQGRAIKAVGTRTIDDNISISTDYVPTNRMYLREKMAVYARVAGSTSYDVSEWAELKLEGLPRFNAYVDNPADVTALGENDLDALRELEMPLSARPESQGLENVSLAVTGFLPYARLIPSWVPGGSQFNPFVRFSVEGARGSTTRELLANDPRMKRTQLIEQVDVTFHWAEDEAEIERFRQQPRPKLKVRVPSAGFADEFSLAGAREAKSLRGTPYTLQVIEVLPGWRLSTGEIGWMARVAIEGGPTGRIERAVVWPDVTRSQDLDGEGRRHQGLLDENIELELSGIPQTGLNIIGSPQGARAMLVSIGGDVVEKDAPVGETVELLDGALNLRIDALSENARRVDRPFLTPSIERSAKDLPATSVIRVAVTESDGTVTEQWLPYSHYPHPSIVGFFPRMVELNDGREVELVYSRESFMLPTEVVLERFELETYPGKEQPRDYISMVKFVDNGEIGELEEIRSNQPTGNSGWWYFQSTWDPPRPQINHAGMNYTGLGVGNRHGVWPMLIGSILVTIGTIYSFYVKPVLIRRIRDRSRERTREREERVEEPRIDEAPAAIARVREST